MKCIEIGYGTYDCAYNIMLPYLITDPTEPEKPPFERTVAIDKCLIYEVIRLWEMGIKTTGCCCGHGRAEPFIGVKKEYIQQMKDMGYKVHYNSCRPNDEDSFIPKTQLDYNEIEKGFNWWNN